MGTRTNGKTCNFRTLPGIPALTGENRVDYANRSRGPIPKGGWPQIVYESGVATAIRKIRSEPIIPPGSLVDHPAHYNAGGIECIDGIEAALGREQFIGFLRGQVIKYQWRLGHKDAPAQDAAKANWYGARLQELLERTA